MAGLQMGWGGQAGRSGRTDWEGGQSGKGTFRGMESRWWLWRVSNLTWPAGQKSLPWGSDLRPEL